MAIACNGSIPAEVLIRGVPAGTPSKTCSPVAFSMRSSVLSSPTQFDVPKYIVATSAAIAFAFALPFSTPPALADFLSYDHADMRGANLSGKDLKGSVFAACDCRLINLEGSNLDSSIVTFAGFQGANLQNTSWIRALADRVVFRAANLRNANFTNAILTGSQFDGKNLIDDNIAGADITGADFTDSIVDKFQRLKMCKKADGRNPLTGIDTRESLFC